MVRKSYILAFAFGFVLLIAIIFATNQTTAQETLMALQGNVLNASGSPIDSGNLRVVVYDAVSNGNEIYNSTTDFNGAILNGKYDVLVGNGSNKLHLEYGKQYYLAIFVNGENFSYNGSQRQLFQSSVGIINVSFINKTAGTAWYGQTLDIILDDIHDRLSGSIVGYTALNYTGNITNGSFIGYVAANAICAADFASSHFCTKDEVLKTIAGGNYSFSGTAWFQNGPPGYTANADDCQGWTSASITYLGPFWNWDGNDQAGYGRLVNCAQTKPLMCCS